MAPADRRLVPQPPPAGRRLRVVFDTDIATEIDDVYAIALALCATDRFAIEGFSAAHFANKPGRDSMDWAQRFQHRGDLGSMLRVSCRSRVCFGEEHVDEE